MFGVGWTEMLVIGVVALIVIGPKDLPVVMHRIGKVIGTVRRMGNEFQREINRTAGLDQITDIRRSITEPLKQTAAELQREFNSISATGSVVPSGVIAPKTPDAESVVDEIHERLGTAPAMTGPQPPVASAAEPLPIAEPGPVQPAEPAPPFIPPASLEPIRSTPTLFDTPAVSVESPAPVEAIAPVKKPRAPRKPRVAAGLVDPTATALAAEDVKAVDAAIKATKPRKPRTPKPKPEA